MTVAEGEQESEERPWVPLQPGIIKQKPSVLSFVIRPIRPSVLWLEVKGHVTTQSCKAKEADVERERTEHTRETVAGHFWQLLPPQSARVCLGLSFCIIIPERL